MNQFSAGTSLIALAALELDSPLRYSPHGEQQHTQLVKDIVEFIVDGPDGLAGARVKLAAFIDLQSSVVAAVLHRLSPEARRAVMTDMARALG